MPLPVAFYTFNGSLAGKDAANADVTAAGAGALRWRQGQWAGTQAAFVEEGTTNLCTNPSFETTVPASTYGTTVRSTDVACFGTSSLKFTPGGTNVDAFTVPSNTVTLGSNATYTLTAHVWIPSSSTFGADANPVKLTVWYNNGGGNTSVNAPANMSLRNQWQRLSVQVTLTGSATLFSPRLYSATTDVNGIVYWDGVQIGQKDHATSYCDGSLGTGYSWSGTAHASSSTRAAASVAVPYSGTLGSFSLMYSEDSGATWTYLYRAAPVAGSIGTNGTITDSGTALTLSSSRALAVGPVMLFDRALTAAEQTTLSGATQPWTWDMLLPRLRAVLRIGRDRTIALRRLDNGHVVAVRRWSRR